MNTQETNQTCQLLSAKELAKMLSLSKRQVFRLDSCGKLGVTKLKIGGSVRFRQDEVADWLAAGAPDRKTWEAMKTAGGE
ncbi:MAG: helix-turn-helix transcriptional regulator [Planctomycetota bacterium]|jgi:excisionase family DNA binding protein